MEVHHVGIATDDGAAATALFTDLFDAPVVHRERLPDRNLAVTFVDLGDAFLELLAPTAPEGPIAEYLDRSGPGIHHLAVAVDDLSGTLDRVAAAGFDLVDEGPRPGAWGHDVAFLYPGSTGGVLVELVET
ncbi:methylmalonyl-CoA epimerase [Halobacteriales archaeon SW_7_68_16]|nr:MAG: methylmalonyl-CoA epimerase [Halobacteriales archaeon SW_7_68_16]